MASGAAQALDALRCSPDGPDKGARFEHLSEGFLKALYGATDIRPVVPDLGVDRLFTDDQGNTVAAQMKCYAPGHTVKMADVNNFITEAKKHKATAMVLLVTSDLSRHAADKAGEYGITVHGFDDLVSVDCWSPLPAGVEPPLTMRPHQQAAYDAAMATPDLRGLIIMPCRTGKSLVEAELAGAHASSLVTVPTIALTAQMAADIRRQHPTKPMLLVYSGDELDKSTTMPIRATTDPKRVKEFRAAHPEHILISTYHSAHLLAGQQPFDLILCDEAHRLATNTTRENGFKVVLHDQDMPAKRRLFFTATPRVTHNATKAFLKSQGLPVYSMDDPALFGARLHEMTWADAVGQDLILSLNLIAPLANEASLMASITANNLTKTLQPYLSDAAKVRDVASVVGMLDAHTRYGITTLLTFHSSIAKSHDAEQITQAVAAAMGIPIKTLTVTSQSPKGHVARALAMLEPGKQELNIVFSVQMFTEGINTPALDAVVYFEPKRSVVSIAQSLARPVTKSPDKQAAYAILPVFADVTGDLEANIDASEWAGVKSVARALFSFGMTPEQIDIDIQTPTGVIGGGGQSPFTFVFTYDPAFNLEAAKANIEAAVIRLDPALRFGQPCPVVMDDQSVCGRPIVYNGMCDSHNARRRMGTPMGQPWQVWPGNKGQPCAIEMSDGTLCGRPIAHNGMCNGHNQRYNKGVDMGKPWLERNPYKGQPCQVVMSDGQACGRPIRYQNLCAGHSRRAKNGVDMAQPWAQQDGLTGQPCPVPMDDGSTCAKPIRKNGMCTGHDTRRKNGTQMGMPWKVDYTGMLCAVAMNDGTTCGRPVASDGVCLGHYQRQRLGVDMGSPWRQYGLTGDPCPVEMHDGRPCGKPIKFNGMCEGHNARKVNGVDMAQPWAERSTTRHQPCPIEMADGVCGRPISSNDMCIGHNRRLRESMPLGQSWPKKRGDKGKPCPIVMDDGEVCGKPISSGGLCPGHYSRKRDGRSMTKPWVVPDGRRGEACPIQMDDGTHCDRPITQNGLCASHNIRRSKGQPMGRAWKRRDGGQPCPIEMDDGRRCGRPIVSGGMCKGHRDRRAYGTDMGKPWLPKKGLKGTPCPIKMDDGTECGKPIVRHGMCAGHNHRRQGGTDMGRPWDTRQGASPMRGSRPPTPCPVVMDDGTTCGKPVRKNGMCVGHAARQKNGTDMGKPWLVRDGRTGQPCPVRMDDGTTCGKPIRKNGVCLGHEYRQKNGVRMGAPWRVMRPKSSKKLGWQSDT